MNFLTEDFLLHNDFARKLYHGHAQGLPVIDYHCHLSPHDISTNRRFENLTAAWLEGDHYKWRAMRTLGVAEKYITGHASPEEKFAEWAHTVPYTIRNPLYHWTHLELKRYFGITDRLSPDTATTTYKVASEKLRDPSFSTRGMLNKMKVEVVCTTDDPLDTLEHHRAIAADNFAVRILPTFRPDKAIAIENPGTYNTYVDKLGQLTGAEIHDFSGLLTALEQRIDFFHRQGCRLSDHGLEHLYFPHDLSHYSATDLFSKVRRGQKLERNEVQAFKYTAMLELCRLYHRKGWTQQFHLGALRNTNTRMLHTLGPDTGFDSIGDYSQAEAMAGFFNVLDTNNQLAKTIVYNLNPADNEVMASMIGNFNDGSAKGKMQFGSAWWFLDQKDGMEKQLNALSNLGLLSCFIGMLTDSRSFLSYPRHEYFRRILCNLIGRDVENGELPADEYWLGKIVSDICYNNAREYFRFHEPVA